MQFNAIKSIKDIKDGILAVAVFQGKELVKELPGEIAELAKFLRKEEFEAKQGQMHVLSTLGKFNFSKLLFYGLGEEKDFNTDFLRRFGGAAVRYASGVKSAAVSFILPSTKSIRNVVQPIAEGAVLAGYKCIKFKTKKEDYFEVKTASIVTNENVDAGLGRAILLADAQNYIRDVCETPGNIITPQKLAEFSREVAKQGQLACTVFEKPDLQKMKMNAILAVGQGSTLPPVLVILEYNKDKKDLPLYAIVGKGITFDSGGISLKPAKGMQEMKYDKTGAVVVLGVMKSISMLKLPIRLIGAFAATENMPSGSAQRPGDIITAYNGKTIEILNTDAEGRLILADTLAYVAERKPQAIIDLATLTGAIIVSLGRYRIGLFSNDDSLAKTIFDAGEHTFERVWRMPLDKEYAEMDKGEFADIKNIGSETGDAGSITAAAFLQEFIGDCKWAHLDIAGVESIVEKHSYLDKGASGIGLRLVIETLERLIK